VNLVQDGKLNRDAAAAELKRYLDEIIRAGKFNLRVRVEAQDGAADADEFESAEIVAAFEGADSELLLAHSAELLKALEYVAIRSLHLEPQFYDRVRFDCGNYRDTRFAELKLSAQVAAQRVRETHTPFRFNPMTARERRVIHLVLKNQAGVRSASEGNGDARYVVIFPADSR